VQLLITYTSTPSATTHCVTDRRTDGQSDRQ